MHKERKSLIKPNNLWVANYQNQQRIKYLMSVKIQWLDGFYGISILVGYLMSYPVYTYIKYMWFVGDIFKQARVNLLTHN